MGTTSSARRTDQLTIPKAQKNAPHLLRGGVFQCKSLTSVTQIVAPVVSGSRQTAKLFAALWPVEQPEQPKPTQEQNDEGE